MSLHKNQPLFALFLSPRASYSAKQEDPMRIRKMGKSVQRTLSEKAVATGLRPDGIFLMTQN